MRALRLETIGSVSLKTLDEPAAGEGEVVLQVGRTGICGSDRHLISGEYPAVPPVTLGHEVEGTVVEAGAGSSLAAGTRVAVDPNIACMKCRYCRLGLVAHCLSLHAVGVDRDGGLADYVVVPERQAYALPDDLPSGFGALCEPLACCLRAIDHARVTPGQTAAVLGGGVVGQLLSQLARLGGAKVVLVTRQRERRELAESLGAAATLDPSSGDVAGAIAGPAGFAPGGVDVAFEAAGVEDTFQQSMAVVRNAGRVVVVGAAPSSLKTSISPFDLFARELDIVGSHLNPLTHGRAVDLAASGSLDLAPLITRTVGLGEAEAVLMGEPGRGEVKVQVAPA
ncbi:MAG TPA: alcohol dehydrogenase catalytic domain-containing protein [Acidimicrobiales bacterium]|nr:alcohol dehydrogenase catalytic domain-containing protein [Acidimicrobiales bacterium]